MFFFWKGLLEMAEKSIETVLQGHSKELMSIPGVNGTGLGACEGTPCIKVFVTQLTDEIRAKVPERLEGYRVKVEVSGPFRALG